MYGRHSLYWTIVFRDHDTVDTAFIGQLFSVIMRRSTQRPGRTDRARKVMANGKLTREYMQTLHKTYGPIHGTMGYLRTTFGARAGQVRVLRRKHLDLTMGKLWLVFQKKRPGEWVDIPANLLKILRRASEGKGIIGSIRTAAGARGMVKRQMAFKIPGGTQVRGTSESQELDQ